jgi:hypothetical protein
LGGQFAAVLGGQFDRFMHLVGLVDILLFRNYNKRNSRLVLALILSCSFHTRKSIGKRLSASFLLSYVRSWGK